MAIESYFEDIADAIRERGGTSATLTPAAMPQAILDIPGGGGGGLLNEITPLHVNVTTGYVSNGNWIYSTAYNNLNTTVFPVVARKHYLLMVGASAERFRSMFSTTDVALATGDVSGTLITNVDYATSYEVHEFVAPNDGFVSVYVGGQTRHAYCFEGSLP